MLEGPFALAVAAGMAATVNPCGFALLPAYLAAFMGEDHQPGASSVARAFAVSARATAGFVVVFGLFGAVISPLAVSIERYLPWSTPTLRRRIDTLAAGSESAPAAHRVARCRDAQRDGKRHGGRVDQLDSDGSTSPARSVAASSVAE